MSRAFVVGVLKQSADGKTWALDHVDVYSGDLESMTQKFGANLVFSQLSPIIRGASFGEALENCHAFAEKSLPQLRGLFVWLR